MKNVFLIPTDQDQPSRIYYNGTSYKDPNRTTAMDWYISSACYKPYNIYITSDDKFIKDEYITDGNEVIKATPKLVDAQGLVDRRDWKKIVICTDAKLIADGVQSVDENFLQWFVKNQSCEEVEIFYQLLMNLPLYQIIIPSEEPKIIECYFIPSNNTSSATICGNCGQEKFLHTIGSGIKVSKSVIITKEEPKQEWDINTCTYFNIEIGCEREKCICENTTSEEPKQETSLEEAAYQRAVDRNWNPNSLETRRVGNEIIEAVKFGAKWQQEQDKNRYSEDDVINILTKREEYLKTKRPTFSDYLTNEEWFEIFKKK
jgi:hypothetical protein